MKNTRIDLGFIYLAMWLFFGVNAYISNNLTVFLWGLYFNMFIFTSDFYVKTAVLAVMF